MRMREGGKELESADDDPASEHAKQRSVDRM
jgi:hypothetical protein